MISYKYMISMKLSVTLAEIVSVSRWGGNHTKIG
jgi:hypothetical protein